MEWVHPHPAFLDAKGIGRALSRRPGTAAGLARHPGQQRWVRLFADPRL